MAHPYYHLDPDEQRRVDHDDMVECATEMRYTPMQRETFQKAHDRIYGVGSACDLCVEPIVRDTLARVQRMFENS